jgi:nicotinamide-nucleotide adenylyltransferase/phosphinothricin biosynthesis protein PhpF
MEYLLAGKARCDFLYVGVSMPDFRFSTEQSLAPHRSLVQANPFTYYERLSMIRNALKAAQVPREAFEIVPFPVDAPELLRHYVPLNACFFVTIYDDWGREKVKTLTALGIQVEVMWERSISDRLTTGTEVRELMANGGKWERLVPAEVREYILEHKLIERMERMPGS